MPYGRFVSDFWDKLSVISTTCAEFSTGLEELQVFFKILFSSYLCPVIAHTRPVPWLHNVFYNAFGWMTWVPPFVSFQAQVRILIPTSFK